MQQPTQTATTAQKPSVISPIAIIGALFFIFGFITWLNTVLVPYLKIACQLNNRESFLVASAFYIAYLVNGSAIHLGIEKVWL